MRRPLSSTSLSHCAVNSCSLPGSHPQQYPAERLDNTVSHTQKGPVRSSNFSAPPAFKALVAVTSRHLFFCAKTRMGGWISMIYFDTTPNCSRQSDWETDINLYNDITLCVGSHAEARYNISRCNMAMPSFVMMLSHAWNWYLRFVHRRSERHRPLRHHWRP